MTAGYSPNSWLSSDTQGYSPITEWTDMSSLTSAQSEFLLNKKINNRREKHIYKKLIFRVEKYSVYKQTFPDYTEEQLTNMLDQNFETSIQYEDIYTMRRVSTNMNTPPQLGVIDLPEIDRSKLYVYDPKNSMARLATDMQTQMFASILKSESTRVEYKLEDGSYYIISKNVWSSIPMFMLFVRERDVVSRYYFFYLTIHNNAFLSTPLLSIQESEQSDAYLLYNNKGKRISKLSTDLH